MVYSIDIRRHPSRVVQTESPRFKHVCGGTCQLDGFPKDPRYVQILSFDLADPALSFLRLKGASRLPLVMDTAAGAIAYSVNEEAKFVLHGAASEGEEPLLEGPLPERSMSVVPFTYEQYRAAWFSTAVIDPTYLQEQDQEAQASLGESYTQVGGAHPLAGDWSPYCQNPDCLGFQRSCTMLLASVAQSPAEGIYFDCWPNDPSLLFNICTTCNSIYGMVST